MRMHRSPDDYRARYLPDGEAERDLLIAFVRASLPDDWVPLFTLDGKETPWEWRMAVRDPEFLRDLADGSLPGYLETRRREFDAATFLSGQTCPMQFWCERTPSFGGEIALVKVCWFLDACPLAGGRADRNFLPHRPVLFAENE